MSEQAGVFFADSTPATADDSKEEGFSDLAWWGVVVSLCAF